MKFTPVQTNQRPLGEKLVQRIWECARALFCLPTPFFMRRWRVFVTKMFFVLNMAEASYFSPGGLGGVLWVVLVGGGFVIDMVMLGKGQMADAMAMEFDGYYKM